MRLLFAAAAGLLLASCAHQARWHSVPIDARPTPRSPDAAATAHPAPAAPPRVTAARIAADTLAAHAAIARCAGRTLLPEQDSTVDSARRLLADAHAALDRGDLGVAESLARQARQLTRSLNCR